MKYRLQRWTEKAIKHPLAEVWLALVSFAEASFFPLPPDMFLIPMVAMRRKDWLRLAAVTSLYSVLGGMFGYAIGWLLFASVAQPLIEFYGLAEDVARVGQAFQDNTFWAVFISAFTPIPYKVFTITSGMFLVNVGTFVVASFLGRSARFLFEGWVMKKYGAKISAIVFRSFNTITLALVVVLLILILFITH